MFLGTCHQQIGASDYSVRFKNSVRAIPLKAAGNPFHGEKMAIDWKVSGDIGADIHITLPDDRFLHTMVVKTGVDSALTALTVWSADKSRRYAVYAAETGHNITEHDIALPVECADKNIILTLDGSAIDIDGIELYASDMKGLCLFPQPDSITEQGGFLPFDRLTVPCEPIENARFAMALLTDKLYEKCHAAIRASADASLIIREDASLPENGYELSVTEDGVTLTASDRRGFVYAAEVLVKLASPEGIACCTISDKPLMGFRGLHLYIPAPDQVEFTRRLVKYLISPLGYNAIIFEVAGGMEFKSHPEINAAVREAYRLGMEGKQPKLPHGSVAGGQTLPQETLSRLIDDIREYGIDVIPEIQSLGHVQYLTLSHPEVAEIEEAPANAENVDTRKEDALPPVEFHHCYCPSNEKSYEIMFDLMDEILKVFRPRKYVHMGHDEVYKIGVCPICRKKDPAELYARDVIRYHDYLAKRGLKMMIWSDMIQPVTAYKTPPAIDMIPKDIVMLDFIWYFHPEKDIEDDLLSKGFNVIMGNMYSSHYTRFEKRARKDGMIGAQSSAWVETKAASLNREGKLYDFIYSAQMMWSRHYDSKLRYAYDAMVRALYPALRGQLEGRIYPSARENAQKEPLYRQDFAHSLPEGEPFSCRVNKRAASVIIEQCATRPLRREPWQPFDVIGNYAVRYADGQTETIPVTYGGTICHWERRYGQPFESFVYRHNGYFATYLCDGVERRLSDGRFATSYRSEWINPRPDVAIESITLEPNTAFDTSIAVLSCEICN